jgi:hypothetical protein
MLIDATMNLDYDPAPEFGGARFPPLAWPAQDDVDAAKAALGGLRPQAAGTGVTRDSSMAGPIPTGLAFSSNIFVLVLRTGASICRSLETAARKR